MSFREIGTFLREILTFPGIHFHRIFGVSNHSKQNYQNDENFINSNTKPSYYR